MRWLKATIIILLIAIVWLTSPVGLYLTMGILANSLSGNLRYHSLSGSLLGTIHIHKFHYQSQHASVDIDALSLKIEPLALFKKHIIIRQLAANKVNVDFTQTGKNDRDKNNNSHNLSQIPKTRASVSNKKEKSATLLFAITIGKSQINNIKIITTEKELNTQFKKLTISGVINHRYVNLNLKANSQRLHSTKIEIKAIGPISNYKIQASTKGDLFNWQLAGNGNTNGLKLDIKKSSVLDGYVNGKITITWHPTLKWSINSQATAVSLKRINTTWPQRLSFHLKAKGDTQSKQVQINNMAMLYKNRTLSGTIDLFYKNKNNFTFTSHLQGSGSKISLNLSRDNLWNFNWKVDVVNLANLWPGLHGLIKSSGTLSGTPLKLTSNGNIQASGLSFKNNRIGQLAGKWFIDNSDQQPSSIDLTAQNLKSSHATLKAISLNSEGYFKNHNINAKIQNKLATLNIALHGDWENNKWQGTLKKANLISSSLGTWNLQKPSKLELSRKNSTLPLSCFNSSKGKVCFDFNLDQDKSWATNIQASKLDTAVISKFLNKKIQIKGKATINIAAKGAGKNINDANFNINTGPTKIQFIINKKRFQNTIKSASLTGKITQQGAHAKMHATLSTKEYFSGNINLPAFHTLALPKANQSIAGQINWHINRVDFLTGLIRQVHKPQGYTAGKFKLSGTLAKPNIFGQGKIRLHYLKIPKIGLISNRANIDINAQGKKVFYSGKLFSKNPLYITGSLTPSITKLSTKFKLTGNNVLIEKIGERTIYASPNLSGSIHGKVVQLTGSILLPKASITPQNYSGVTKLPGDVIFVDNGYHKKSFWKVSMQITLTAGKNITFFGDNIKGKIGGHLLLIKKPTTSILATGKLFFLPNTGTYTTRGKVMTITQGALNFINSPLNDPYLDVQAARAFQSMETGSPNASFMVGLNIKGTFQHPKISLFSSLPALSQADILSYLILGHSSGADASSVNITLLMQALDSLTSSDDSSSGGITQQFYQGFGLDEFGVESDVNPFYVGNPLLPQSSFVIGRYFSPKIYIRYSVGLISNINTLQIRYIINNTWYLQTSSSNLGNGLDIFYSYQKK